MHGRKSDSSTDTLSNSHRDDGSEVGLGHDGGEEGADYVNSHGEEHHPLGGELLGHSRSRNLREEVAPEVTTQDHSLKRFAPRKRSILEKMKV